MSLTNQDREWVRSIVKEAVKEAFIDFYKEMESFYDKKEAQGRERLLIETSTLINDKIICHERACSNIANLKTIVCSVIVSLVVLGSVFGTIKFANGLVEGILKWF